MADEPPVDEVGPPGDQESAPGLLTPSLTSFVSMAAGATLMIAAVFGTELVHERDARFSLTRLGVAGVGLLVLLIGFAWFLDPPKSERAD